MPTYDEGEQPYAQARPPGTDEILRLVGDYVNAARNAMAARFDGVEVHAANGYLIDEFLRESTNRRDDRYGGWTLIAWRADNLRNAPKSPSEKMLSRRNRL